MRIRDILTWYGKYITPTEIFNSEEYINGASKQEKISNVLKELNWPNWFISYIKPIGSNLTGVFFTEEKAIKNLFKYYKNIIYEFYTISDYEIFKSASLSDQIRDEITALGLICSNSRVANVFVRRGRIIKGENMEHYLKNRNLGMNPRFATALSKILKKQVKNSTYYSITDVRRNKSTYKRVKRSWSFFGVVFRKIRRGSNCNRSNSCNHCKYN